MDAAKLCMGCMGETGGAPVCPDCQWQAGTPAESPLYLAPGTVLHAQYLVGRVLGHGGFGITYIGMDLNLARKIAIKEYFPAGIAMRPTGGERVSAYSGAMQKDFQWGLERYLEEARVLARFDHPNISSVINFFSANGTAYMILDYLDGMTFEKLLERRGGRVPWETATQIMVPVMDALREVHKAGILHRDISPDNIYILKTGQIKVIDFGAARYALGQQSKNLSIILKEGYAPEEQYRSKGNQGPWTDVYATAATMYRALTGKVPMAALDRQRADELEPPSALGVTIPPDKERALMKALAVQAEDRFPDMGAFEEAVLADGMMAAPPLPEPLPRPLPRPVPPPVPPPLPSPVMSRPPLPKWIFALAGVAVLAVAAVAVKLGSHKAPETAGVTPSPPAAAGGTAPLPAGPRIVAFQADPASVEAGQSTRIRWSVQGADHVEIQGLGTVPAEGDQVVTPRQSVDVVLTATGGGGQATQTASITVTPPAQQPQREVPPYRSAIPARNNSSTPPAPPPPAPATEFRVVDFGVSPASIVQGQQAMLHWNVAGAAGVTIVPMPGRVPASGQIAVFPTANMNYQLIAVNPRGQQLTGNAYLAVAPLRSGMVMPPQPVYQEAYPRQQIPQAPAMSWMVFHDHDGFLGLMNRYTQQQWHYCQGQLTVAGNHLRYNSPQEPAHDFDAPLSEVEVKTIRRTIQGRRAFEVKIDGGGHYNFVSGGNVDAIVAAINRAAR